MILTPLQKLRINVCDLGKIIAATLKIAQSACVKIINRFTCLVESKPVKH